jgi:hypothetical protein
LRKSDDGLTASIYETESQLFPKKSEVKLQKHSNHIAARAETRKNGQDTREANQSGKYLITIN